MKNAKNAPILLIFGVSNKLNKRFVYTKYEQNWGIFDSFLNFGPFYFDDMKKRNPKFVICCLKKANLSLKGSKIKGQVGALGLIFDWEGHISNGCCAVVFGPGPKLFD